jgi:hypothetical protein
MHFFFIPPGPINIITCFIFRFQIYTDIETNYAGGTKSKHQRT